MKNDTVPLFRLSVRQVVTRAWTLITVAGLLAAATASAQQWEAAATMQGYVLSPNVVTLPDATSLVALRKFEPIRSDTFLFYSVASLLADQQPWPEQLPLPVLGEGVTAVYESNGPGPSDVRFSTITGTRLNFMVDAFTPTQRLRETGVEGGKVPPIDGRRPTVSYQGDLDGDGIQDYLSSVQDFTTADINYGDAQEPYLQWSTTERDPKASSDFRSTIMMVGRLSGRVCMVRLVFKYDSWDAGYYQLVELNPDDLAARRDTIRSTVLREIANPQRYSVFSRVLRADTVWHFFGTTSASSAPSLKVTIDSCAFRTAEAPLIHGDNQFWFGQRKRWTNWWYPVVMDADRPIAAAWDTGIMRVFACTNTDNATIDILGDATLPGNNNSYRGYITSLVMIPDYDGDGIEDIVVEHGWHDTDTSSVVRMYTSVFLTTHRQPVSVAAQEQTLPLSDTAHAIDAFRRGASWVAPGAGYCLQHASTGTLYLLDGSAVGTATARLEGADVVLDDTGRLPASAAWFVIGRCVFRLR